MGVCGVQCGRGPAEDVHLGLNRHATVRSGEDGHGFGVVLSGAEGPDFAFGQQVLTGRHHVLGCGHCLGTAVQLIEIHRVQAEPAQASLTLGTNCLRRTSLPPPTRRLSSMRSPNLVATATASRTVTGSPANACPMTRSECPVPYVGAVSISVTPASIAVCSARMLSASSTSPHPASRPSKVNGPPRAHVPTPTAESCRPPAPSERASAVVVLIATPGQLMVQRPKCPPVVGAPAA